MRKTVSFFLILSLLACLCGCSLYGIKEPVEFFYPRRFEDLKLTPEEGAIASEMREASGHREDLNYLLSLYLQGPLDDSLASPFPVGTRLLEIKTEDSVIHVTLNYALATLEGTNLSIACACLAKTCLSMTGMEQVHIMSTFTPAGNVVDVTLDADSLLLEEGKVSVTAPPETITDSQ